MNHKLFVSKSNLFAIVLILAASIVLVTVISVRATQYSQLQELARIKEGEVAVEAVLSAPSRLEELYRVKDDLFPDNIRFSGPSRLEEMARIKEDVLPADALLSGPSRLEELARIKER